MRGLYILSSEQSSPDFLSAGSLVDLRGRASMSGFSKWSMGQILFEEKRNTPDVLAQSGTVSTQSFNFSIFPSFRSFARTC